jgi:hypothetical protein
VAHVVGAFGGGEEAERGRHQRAHLIEAPWASGAKKRFQFGKGLLDRIEVGAVGRQKAEMRLRGFNCGANLRVLVDRQVVEYDDVARAQRGHQHLFDIREERGTVDGPIEDRRRGEPLEAQPDDEGVGLPVTARRAIVQPRAAWAAAIAPQQVRRDATLIEKDVLTDIAQRLGVLPPAPGGRDIRAPLFVRVYGFF